LPAEGAAAVQALQLARAAAGHMEAGEPAAAVEKLQAASALRPDFASLALELATAQAAAGAADDALRSLEQYAAFGLYAPVERLPAFAPLRARSEFQGLVKRIAANQHAKGGGEIAFSLRDVTGLIEGIAWREQTGEFLFGDVQARTIWVRAKDGALRRLLPEAAELWGVFGLAIDETSGTIWAATSAVPEMSGFEPDLAGAAAVAEIDLASGTLRRVIAVPRRPGSDASHRLTDIALGPDGTVWVADGGMPQLWRLPPGAAALEALPESSEYFALQGVAVLPSGTVLVADQINGLVRVGAARGDARGLPAPPATTLGDITSLTLAPDGRVLALQTGVRPNRLLRVELEGDGEAIARVEVLESGHIAMGAPSQGCIGAGGHYHFIGHAGWSRFSAGDGRPSAPRQVPVFRTTLTPARR